ncbi:tyrosine-type recombinase/integrase [Aliarcobacter lanthieri]|uniref:tyrosine-type recombinase/integrase n=1 Tax=Aliarcobacter lanthieri TaxID=1355374 RepID=UPI003AADB2AF
MSLKQKEKKLIFNEFKAWVVEESEDDLEINSNTLVINYVNHLLYNDTLNARSLRTVNKSKFKLFLEEIKKIKIGDICKETINNAIDKSLGNIPNKKILKQQFKNVLFVHAMRDGVLSKYYDSYFMKHKYFRHIEIRNDIALEHRTIGWYVCEFLYKKEQERGKIYGSDLTIFKQSFQSVWNLFLKEFTLNMIATREGREKSEIRKFLVFLNNYGFNINLQELCNINNNPIDFNSDIWEVTDNEKRSRIDFSNYTDDMNINRYLKEWLRFRIENNSKGHKKYLRLLKIYFLDYLKEHNIKLLNFSNNQKRIWLFWLREGVICGNFKNGTIRNVVSSTKQFTNFLRDNKKVKFKYDFTWIVGKDSIPDKSSKRKAYEQWELDRIVDALKSDTDRVFINIEKIILLTGRRLGEVLSLKHDCLVKISSVDCIRYTASKISQEITFPLPTKKIKNDDGLFLVDPKEVIIEAINELLEIRKKNLEYCNDKDKRFLIIDRFENFNIYGFLSGKMTKSNFYSKLYSFKIRNRINFEFESHRFRNTIATKIIRTNGDINVASKVLGNTPATVARHYESELSKKEIIDEGSLFALNAENNAKKILEEMNNVPEVCSDGFSCNVAVPGGFCKKGLEAMMSCKFYNRLFGKGGCLGCSQLAITTENKTYYEELKENILVELENTTGTPAAKASMSKYRLISKTLSSIENAKDNQWK